MFCSPYYYHHHHCHHHCGCDYFYVEKKKSKKQLEREKLRRDVDESIFKYALKTERRDHEILWKNMHKRYTESQQQQRPRSSSK